MTKTYYYISFTGAGSCYTRCFDTKEELDEFKSRIGGHLKISSEWIREVKA